MSFKDIVSKIFKTCNTLGFTLIISILIFIITLIDCCVAPAFFPIFILIIESFMLISIVSTCITYYTALIKAKNDEKKDLN